jgi:hypothetical protein
MHTRAHISKELPVRPMWIKSCVTNLVQILLRASGQPEELQTHLNRNGSLNCWVQVPRQIPLNQWPELEQGVLQRGLDTLWPVLQETPVFVTAAASWMRKHRNSLRKRKQGEIS